MGWTSDIVITFTRRLRSHINDDKFFPNSQITEIDETLQTLENCDDFEQTLGSDLIKEVEDKLSSKSPESLNQAISHVEAALQDADEAYSFSSLKWCLKALKDALQSLKICQPTAYINRLRKLLEFLPSLEDFLLISDGSIEDVFDSVSSQHFDHDGSLISAIETTVGYDDSYLIDDDDITDFDFDDEMDSSDSEASDFDDPEMKKVMNVLEKYFEEHTKVGREKSKD